MRFLSNRITKKLYNKVSSAFSGNPFSYATKFYTNKITKRFKPNRRGKSSLVSFYKLQNKIFPKHTRRKSILQRAASKYNNFILGLTDFFKAEQHKNTIDPNMYYSSINSLLSNIIVGSTVDILKPELNFENFADLSFEFCGDYTPVRSSNANNVVNELHNYIKQSGGLSVSPEDVAAVSDEIDINNCATNNTNNRNCKIEYLVIHYTAGTSSKKGSAVNCAKFFAQNEGPGSADFIVDDETMVQYNPDPEKLFCNAVGGKPYKTKGGATMKGKIKNRNSISIEICSASKDKKMHQPNDEKYYFTDKVVAVAAKLSKMLMEKYKIDIDHVYRHYDVNGKPCPGIKGWNIEPGSPNDNSWKQFKKLIS